MINDDTFADFLRSLAISQTRRTIPFKWRSVTYMIDVELYQDLGGAALYHGWLSGAISEYCKCGT